MSRKSMRGDSQERNLNAILEKIKDNVAFIDKNDLKVLEFIATKGDFQSYTPGLIGKFNVSFVDEVEEFNKTFGKPNNYEPTIPEKKEWMFVYDFIQEELEEYREACQEGNIVEVLDALCDITYVSTGNGTMLHGLKDKIWPAYQEVQASNMSKSCKTEEEAKETVLVRAKEQGEECHYEKVGTRWVVYRTRDRKVMKSINYFKPDLKQFFTDKEIQKTHLKQLTGK